MPKDATSAPASSKVKTPASPIPRSPRVPGTPVLADADSTGPSGQDVLLFLVASRILNALIIQTFFQPDEYFQALEPAWALATGPNSGAWLTWVRDLLEQLATQHLRFIGMEGTTTFGDTSNALCCMLQAG